MKMAARAAIVSRRRKDFGGARILAAREEAWEGARGGKGGGGAGQGISGGGVCLSVVCLFLDKLVRTALADCDETFGGGQGQGQERLSPEPARSVKVRARKGREIQILAVSH